jgi:hypothetical protein
LPDPHTLACADCGHGTRALTGGGDLPHPRLAGGGKLPLPTHARMGTAKAWRPEEEDREAS